MFKPFLMVSWQMKLDAVEATEKRSLAATPMLSLVQCLGSKNTLNLV
jgi:hypothetical protein